MAKRKMKPLILAFILLGLGCSPTVEIDWPESGTNLDKLSLGKSKIADCCFRGYVRSIQLRDFDGDGEPEIAVVPQTGVFFFDAATLEQESKIEYQATDGNPIWFGISPRLFANESGFAIAMLGGGFGRVGVLDQRGKLLWEFRPHLASSPDGMVVDDSILEEPVFYSSDKGSIYKLDAEGKVIWTVEKGASHLALIPGRDGEEAELAAVPYGSSALNVWSSTGKLKQQIELPFYPDGLDSVFAESTSGFVIKSGRHIAFVNRAGSLMFVHSYGDLPVYHGPSAELVRFRSHQPLILVVRMTSRSAIGRSVLSMFSLDGDHLYEEYLDGGPSLGVVPVANEGRDRLLVGDGVNALWVYHPT